MKQIEVKRKQIEYLAKAFEIVLFLIIKKKLGLEGSGIFLIPLVIFVLFWTFFGECLSDALASLIRIRKNKGQYKSIRNIRLYALLCQLVMGAIGTMLMLTLGTVIGEKVYGCTYANTMILILSPLIFLRGISSLLAGYCEGEGFELPAVVACLLRIVAIYVFGTILGSVAGTYGEKVSNLLKAEQFISIYEAQGWCVAMLMAELLIILISFFFFLGSRYRKKKDDYEAMKDTASLQGYVSALFRNTFSKVLINFLEIFPIVIGMMIFYHRTGAGATITYGTFFVGYMSICLILARLLGAVAVPFWSKAAMLFRQDEARLTRVCFHGGIHLILALSAILCAGVISMASQVGALAGFTSPNLVSVVVQGGVLIPFMALEFYFSRMLMRFKKQVIALVITLLTDIVFVMVFSMMWSDEKIGIIALTYAGMIAIGANMMLLGGISLQMFGGKLDWLKVVAFPLFMAAAVGILQALCVKFVGDHLESLYVVLIVGSVGFLAYWCALLWLRNFSDEELSVIPFGKTIIGFGKLLGIF